MWGRKDETDSQSTVDTQPTASSAGPARARSSPRPGASATGTGGAAQAVIGKSLKLKGDISGSEDLIIDGEVQGTVELRNNSLTVGPNGNVHADVRARSITVLGRMQGNVHAGERIEIRKTGSLEGDLVTPRILIEDGAVFRGSIDILKAGDETAPATAAKKPAVSAVPAESKAAGSAVPESQAASAKSSAAPTMKT